MAEQGQDGRQHGRVALVGAGPGDPDLLTVKALRLIQSAQVVVYDRLVSREIMELIPASAERIYAGKALGHHHLVQDEINELLLTLARSGRDVVRLKGGDSFVFGRGSEEALHLARHGIHFEVVPGISAAAGCTSYGGIPLTHRGLATGVQFVPGHLREGKGLDLRWDKLADPDTTLVIYMGLQSLPETSAELIKAGLPCDTPAAAIENGTTPRQRRVIGTLADLPERTRAAGLQAPTLIVIGKVVSLAGELDWFMTEGGGS
ncbi:uroporphyrin-III methyltransferase [Paramagnetospirillum marisnigri]|uniref:uroporphyrinogen-III C-methyltransferase n=1 Tax=Paramagnetospirillum marisnigri TaxID=1285242 RepID=A0A178MRK9_9PROT|nr:uroporphyrinogen-III C-methyltransferase [Paramagnetospirillum marisnigri]OAN50584.1 uroporphyrin-III methyltransferase [Paramagnetospirillum marisnigri]